MGVFNPFFFDFSDDVMSSEDFDLACSIVGNNRVYHPDLDIRPRGEPYMFRWWVTPKSKLGNVFFHIQVASDIPELHDHPWDNMSVILSGGYDEIFTKRQHSRELRFQRQVRKGDVVQRYAEEAHTLILPPDIPYTMTLFSTGPVVREWGFWFPDGWRSAETDVVVTDGVSQLKEMSNG